MNRLLLLLSIFILTIHLYGCDAKPPVQDLTEADQTLVELFQEEENITPILRSFERTTWIYVPFEFDFFKIQLTDKGKTVEGEAKISKTMRFVETHLAEYNLKIAYDVGENKTYMKTYGYNNTYSEEFSALQRNALSYITRSYADLEKKDQPTFFAIVFANTKLGLKLEMIINNDDLIRAHTDHSFNEEFVKRLIQNPLEGDKRLIGDIEGQYLKTHDITWAEFIALQIQYRIEFTYGRSIFPPSEHTREELLNIVSLICSFYEYDGIKMITLHDLNFEREEQIAFTDIESEVNKKELSGGKLHVINFNGGGSR